LGPAKSKRPKPAVDRAGTSFGEIKNEVVIEDPHEKGIRKALNFGHTVGHAVETYSLMNDADPLSHGEAIAIGMICEAWLSNKKIGLPDKRTGWKLPKCLFTFTHANKVHENTFPTLLEHMAKDKKNQNGKINCTLLKHIGEYSIDNICTEDRTL
jgi:3-dehydroquinate synthase